MQPVICSAAPLASPPPASSASYASVLRPKQRSLHNLRKTSCPSFLEDGTPSIQAPPAVILDSRSVWTDHLVAHFHGSPPPLGKVFADLNPIWGLHGRIVLKKYTARSCLIYIPSEQTRNWVLEVGFWQSGNCAFSVTKWSPSIFDAYMKLDFAPLWVVLRNVPQVMFTIDGISSIASALGIPLYTERANLTPNSSGLIKVRIVMKLEGPYPSSVRVHDKLGNSIIVRAEYPHIPVKCPRCGDFGHLVDHLTADISETPITTVFAARYIPVASPKYGSPTLICSSHDRASASHTTHSKSTSIAPAPPIKRRIIPQPITPVHSTSDREDVPSISKTKKLNNHTVRQAFKFFKERDSGSARRSPPKTKKRARKIIRQQIMRDLHLLQDHGSYPQTDGSLDYDDHGTQFNDSLSQIHGHDPPDDVSEAGSGRLFH